MKTCDSQAHQLAWSVYYQLKYAKTMTVQQLQSASAVLMVASELLSEDAYSNVEENAKADTKACADALSALASSFDELSLEQANTVKAKSSQYKQFLPLLYWL